jgi:hypothetical protein
LGVFLYPNVTLELLLNFWYTEVVIKINNMEEQKETIVPKEIISKKEFLYSFIPVNLVLLFIFIYWVILLFADGFFLVIILIPALIILFFYGVAVNIALLKARDSNDKGKLSTLSFIFIAIPLSIYIAGLLW